MLRNKRSLPPSLLLTLSCNLSEQNTAYKQGQMALFANASTFLALVLWFASINYGTLVASVPVLNCKSHAGDNMAGLDSMLSINQDLLKRLKKFSHGHSTNSSHTVPFNNMQMKWIKIHHPQLTDMTF